MKYITYCDAVSQQIIERRYLLSKVRGLFHRRQLTSLALVVADTRATFSTALPLQNCMLVVSQIKCDIVLTSP